MFYEKIKLLETSNIIKEEIPIQVFFCKFYKIFNKTFFTEHLW